MKQFSIFNFQFSITILLVTCALLLVTHPLLAQTTICGSGDPVRSTGLVTTPSVSGKFSSSGACITDNSVIFAPFKLPTFADLKSIYFDQSKLPKNTKTNLPGNLSGDNLYLITSDLTLDANLTGSGTQVIFVDGKLIINKDIKFPTKDEGGLVFVVKNNVIIDKSVTQINAMIISFGTVYTAGDLCTASSITSSPLLINGALVALNDQSLLKFCRKLEADNKPPAEIINYEPKYLVILRDLFSQIVQKWSEIP